MTIKDFQIALGIVLVGLGAVMVFVLCSTSDFQIMVMHSQDDPHTDLKMFCWAAVVVVGYIMAKRGARG